MNVRVVSPSGAIHPAYIDGAETVLHRWGWDVSEGNFARGQYGRFSGTEAERIADLQEAVDDPLVDVILCSRGGYGLAQIIDKIHIEKWPKGKLLVGFSDITVLHSALAHYNVPSVHGVMAKHITELLDDAEPKVLLHKLLQGEKPVYRLPAHRLNRCGKAEGILRGGNLSVLYGLRGTPYDLPVEGTILFIEDIAERAYHIDRMMQNLRLGGVLQHLSGFVVGQFSDCEDDPLMMQTVEEIIADAVADYDFPVCFNFPAGHVEQNLPLLLNSPACLEVTEQGVLLK